MRFFEEKVHSLSVAPEPLAVWNKELEGLEFELFKELKTSSIAALSVYLGSFIQKELGYRVLAYSLVVCFLSGVVAWW